VGDVVDAGVMAAHVSLEVLEHFDEVVKVLARMAQQS
jgi:hypothetical protein